MTYYYNKNKHSQKEHKPYYRKSTNQFDSYYSPSDRSKDKDIDLDSLIIDGNTVYEIDEECFEKYFNRSKTKKNNS